MKSGNADPYVREKNEGTYVPGGRKECACDHGLPAVHKVAGGKTSYD